jgi:hypothetical protein
MSHFSTLMILFHRSNSLQGLCGTAEYVHQLTDEHTQITDKLKKIVLAIFFPSLPALCIVLAFEKFSPCTTTRPLPTPALRPLVPHRISASTWPPATIASPATGRASDLATGHTPDPATGPAPTWQPAVPKIGDRPHAWPNDSPLPTTPVTGPGPGHLL